MIGEAHLAGDPDFAVKDGYERAFAPGYDICDGFSNPDQVVDDFNAMTYTSYKDRARAERGLRATRCRSTSALRQIARCRCW